MSISSSSLQRGIGSATKTSVASHQRAVGAGKLPEPIPTFSSAKHIIKSISLNHCLSATFTSHGILFHASEDREPVFFLRYPEFAKLARVLFKKTPT